MPQHSQVEIERKYDVDETTAPPLLVGVGAVATQTEPETAELVATYFDTADLTLAHARIAVRVRRGGADQGWHVKLPAEEGRTELHWPLTDGDDVPEELIASVAAVVPDARIASVAAVVPDARIAEAELVPVARVTNRRVTVVLQDAAGFDLAEFCDDHVTSENLRSGGTQSWREWEVELLSGAPDTRSGRTALLDEIEERVLAAGAVVSASSSKLQRALGL
ncbi:CYTH domain-containing protein [Leifsonia sp. Le1]|uniref:CYTH domain-containing protein n=1 Tax=Leifsonia sp. Le1 TaxID=3404918 RepID=UPI003EBB14F9